MPLPCPFHAPSMPLPCPFQAPSSPFNAPSELLSSPFRAPLRPPGTPDYPCMEAERAEWSMRGVTARIAWRLTERRARGGEAPGAAHAAGD
eukprot:5834108-Pyramimonas_sp.AAC.1